MNNEQKTRTQLQLETAVAELYEIFSNYASTTPLFGCPHCKTATDAHSLSGDMTRVPTDVLERFAFFAMTTWGNVDDFKRFLPRLFELLAFDPCFNVDQEVLLSKLDYGHWRDWPLAEQESVETYLQALFYFAINDGENHLRFEELVHGAARSKFDVTRALKTALDDDQSIDTTVSLCKLIGRLSEKLRHRNHYDGPYVNISDWLLSDQIRQRLEDAFFLVMDEPNSASQISQAVNVLDSL